MNMMKVDEAALFVSIHPGVRVVDGVRCRIFPLKNTCKPNKRTGRTLKAVTDKFDRRLASHASTLKDPTVKNQTAFRKPGSRNPGKLRNR